MQNLLHSSITISSEIGDEKRCHSCGEFWPADTEFFATAKSSPDGLSRRCLACIKERLWACVPLQA